MFGTNSGWLAPVLKNSENPTYDITLTLDERSWIASLHQLTVIFGSIFCIFTLDRFGRKKIMSFSSLCCLLGWAVIRFTRSVSMIYISRIIFGIQAGLEGTVVIILIGENCSPNQRGVCTSLFLMFCSGGLVTAYALATYYSYNTVATINVATSFLYFLSTFVMKETVQFLILKRRYEEAKINYRWLFSEDSNDFEKLKQNIETGTTSLLNLTEVFNTPRFYKSISLVTTLTILINSTGYTALLTYTSIAFPSSDILSPNEFTICFGFILLVSSFGSSFLIDRFNRRTILLTVLAASALTNITTAVLYYTQENLIAIPYFPWLIFVTISLFITIGLIGLHPLNSVLRSELFPQEIKVLGVAISNMGAYLTVFFVSFMFLKTAKTFGIFFNFLYFSAMCSVTFAFAYLYVPETIGKSLLEIQEMFEKSNVKI